MLCVLLFAEASCTGAPNRSNTVVQIPRVVNESLSWRAPAYAAAIAGMEPLRDATRSSRPEIAIARAVLHTNARIAPVDALLLAAITVKDARRANLPPEFLAATLLQESAFDPLAFSSAGALGIAQFMPDTAASNGVQPLDPDSAIAGAARLLSAYVRAYARRSGDAYALALAAYNAGPNAVSAYDGVPPYPETQAYIVDIAERWAQIASYERRFTK